MRSSQIGLQLYTVREAAAADMIGTLRRVAEIGYGAVEFAGWGDSSPRDIRQVMESEGIEAIGAHVPLVDLETRPMQTLERAVSVGCEWVVVPSVPESWTRTPEDVSRLSARLNSLGELCRTQSLRLAYHNHAVEFQPLPPEVEPDGATGHEDAPLTADLSSPMSAPTGSAPWDILRAETWPDLVDLELDLFWSAVGGRDPVLSLRQGGGRAKLIHAKDRSKSEPSRDAPLGDGSLPWPELLEVGDEGGVHWWIVEQDDPADAFKDIETSLLNLRRLAGLPSD
jgi:sugar phosphate isomerase/epimerase